jgi:ankyrin repeat protein
MEEEEDNSLKKLYPLHFAVFNNAIDALKSELESRSGDELKDLINRQDIHGRTPVMLATILGHVDCAELLLMNGADANTQNRGIRAFRHIHMSGLAHHGIN